MSSFFSKLPVFESLHSLSPNSALVVLVNELDWWEEHLKLKMQLGLLTHYGFHLQGLCVFGVFLFL